MQADRSNSEPHGTHWSTLDAVSERAAWETVAVCRELWKEGNKAAQAKGLGPKDLGSYCGRLDSWCFPSSHIQSWDYDHSPHFLLHEGSDPAVSRVAQAQEDS